MSVGAEGPVAFRRRLVGPYFKLPWLQVLLEILVTAPDCSTVSRVGCALAARIVFAPNDKRKLGN